MKTLKGIKLSNLEPYDNIDLISREFELDCSNGSEELKLLQLLVGGNIEIPYVSSKLENLRIDIIINEESKLLNFRPTLGIIRNGELLDVICGPVIFLSHDDRGNFVSLNYAQREYLWKTILGPRSIYVKNGDDVIILKCIEI